MDESAPGVERPLTGPPVTSEVLRRYAAFLETAAKALEAGTLEVTKDSGIVESSEPCGELHLNLSIGLHLPRTIN